MKRREVLCFAVLTGALVFAAAAEIKLMAPAEGATVAQLAPIQKKFMELPREEHAEYFKDEGRRRELLKASNFPAPVELAGMGTIPGEFMGARAGSLKADAKGVLTFDKKGDSRSHAVLMQEVDATEEGYLLFNYGVSQYWSLWSNGELLADYTGNVKAQYTAVEKQGFVSPVLHGGFSLSFVPRFS